MSLGIRKAVGAALTPSLFLTMRNGYSAAMFLKDLSAGLTVGVVALPLALAFAIASGLSPVSGLYTAVVAGFVMAFFSGSRFPVSGPTGAFVVIIYNIVSRYGYEGLVLTTLMAGVMLIIFGLLRLGALIKYIPYPVTTGFTAGIALLIFSSQMKDFFGLPLDLSVPAGFIPQWGCYIQNIGNISLTELLMSTACLLICIFWGRVTKKIPGSLIALILGTIASVLLSRFAGIEFATIGSKFPELANGLPMPKPVAPEFSYDTIKGLVSPAFTIAILCAIESLLAAMVADGATGKHHNSNTELIGQGIANIVTPLFGGIPATGALARTMASINNGGKTPVTGIVHAFVLLLIYLFLMPYAIYIPLSCLAAILVMVAYNMSEWRTFRYLLKGDKSDVAVLLITFFLTVIVDLTVAIEVGVVMAIVLFVRRVMETSSIQVLEGDRVAATENEEMASLEDTEHLDIPSGVEVYEINGPFFFGLASRFEEFEKMKTADTKVRIIRMRKVPFIDSTGVNNLRNLCERTRKRGVTVILSGVTENVRATLGKFGVDKEIGADHIFPHIIPALAKANEIVSK